MKKLFFYTMLPLIFLSYGCSNKMYDIAVKNTGKSELSNVKIEFRNYRHSFGYIGTKIEKTHILVGESYPLPNLAVISWTTPDGQNHKETVDVKSKVPSKYKDLTIYFNIDSSNNVTVTCKEIPKDPTP